MKHLFFDENDLKYLGENVIIGKTVNIRRPYLTSIGTGTIIDDYTYISCELEVGEYCHIGPHSNLAGGGSKVTIGNFSGWGAGCTFYAASTDFVGVGFDLPSIPKEYHVGGFSAPITLGDHILLGTNSVVLQGVELPEGFACAIGTVLKPGSYKPWTLYGTENYKVVEICERDSKGTLEARDKFLKSLDNKSSQQRPLKNEAEQEMVAGRRDLCVKAEHNETVDDAWGRWYDY